MSKTIVDKLNLHKYDKIAVLGMPEGENLLEGLEHYDTQLASSGYDMIFAFTLDMGALQGLLNNVISSEALGKGGYLFAAYPKKGNKVYPTYIHRDDLFEGLGASEEDGYIGTSDLKFARMVGLNDVFTVVGFKLEPRKSASSTKPSQSVGDYVAFIPNVEQDLQHVPETLAFYQSLAPGYRRDWARYIYSAVQEETREKRREEMKVILGEGFKSVDLYRRGKQ
ncbi:bacteriocin resistance YdeI/OmpD-like protein [Paenibacillus cellulosilyticus]|uniref:Bacteriocin resistance YdeI/OmpD-like protein n=1 Tax=Paenibacillus cellulosilyticus TaxID=375489 RepID=A0A2V2Z473_9BACL|nr:YdeI/OmpD-associated family protein [Paenibacillus cellulosilyticus]PWW08610.1 bacteriocin resistance YdeI/OmpD-like protein [Paenibacillus cellulosilyticus]QKS48179.1 YdeI/OmpD-associated family protein [Paenibacillus cellulosilyticus]